MMSIRILKIKYNGGERDGRCISNSGYRGRWMFCSGCNSGTQKIAENHAGDGRKFVSGIFWLFYEKKWEIIS